MMTMVMMRKRTRMLMTREEMELFVTVLTRWRPPVPFLARTTLSLLEMYMYLGGGNILGEYEISTMGLLNC